MTHTRFHAWHIPNLTPLQRLILFCLLEWRDEDNAMDMSDIAELCGTTRSTVSRNLKRMELKGVIKSKYRYQGSDSQLPKAYTIQLGE